MVAPPSVQMTELLHAYHTLFLMMIGFGLIVGMVSRQKAFHAVKHTVLMMIAVPFVLSAVSATWAATPFATRVLLLVIGLPVAGLSALIGTAFGREVFASILGNAAYDGLRSRGCSLGCLPLLLLAILLFALLS